MSREPGDMATVWRHLTRWPGLLELIHTGMAPLAPNATPIRHRDIKVFFRQLVIGVGRQEGGDYRVLEGNRAGK